MDVLNKHTVLQLTGKTVEHIIILWLRCQTVDVYVHYLKNYNFSGWILYVSNFLPDFLVGQQIQFEIVHPNPKKVQYYTSFWKLFKIF